MVHRGKHSLEHNLKRSLKGLLLSHAYLDRERAETVNRLGSQEVLEYLSARYEFVPITLVADLERGEVLLDSRGGGSLQRRPDSCEVV
ncbi:MAG: hypothetical protein QXI71_02180 [Candidatus Bathyarchaeia archaeon]